MGGWGWGGRGGACEPLRSAVIGPCVDAGVTVHFDFNGVRLQRLFSIFFLQRELPAVEKRR